MSAYMMDSERLGTLAAAVALCHGELIPERPKVEGPLLGYTEAAILLAHANAESVGYRYSMSNDEAADMAGEPDLARYIISAKSWAAVRARNQQDAYEAGFPVFDGEEISGLCREFDYQACEAPSWDGSRVESWTRRVAIVASNASLLAHFPREAHEWRVLVALVHEAEAHVEQGASLREISAKFATVDFS